MADYIHRRVVRSIIDPSRRRGDRLCELLDCGHKLSLTTPEKRTKECQEDRRRCYQCGEDAQKIGGREFDLGSAVVKVQDAARSAAGEARRLMGEDFT